MTYGAAIFLIAVGAILRFAVTATHASTDIERAIEALRRLMRGGLR